MPTVTPAQALLIGAIVAPGIFLLAAYISRANYRRSFSGLAGAFVFGAFNFGWDRVAERAGWWHYPAYNSNGELPIIFYVFAGLVFSAIALIGWRIIRRFGYKGTMIFLLIWGL